MSVHPAAQRPRVARRRVEDRARLLAAAARLFALRGVPGVRLDEIADAAGLARATLYSHFGSKEELFLTILRPLLERSVETLAALPAGPPRLLVEGLLRQQLDLWRVAPDAMRLAHRAQEAPPPELAPLHAAIVRRTLEVFGAAADAGLLRLPDPVLAARVLARTSVPLLEIFAGRPDADRLFLEGMAALLLVP